MIEWLLSLDPKLVPFIQMAASTLLALASLVVAWAAFRMSRVNSFGTKPVAFFLPVERGSLGGKKGDYLRLRLEVWNRRKYPIFMRSVRLTVDEDGINLNDGDGWQAYSNKNEALWKGGAVIEGTGQYRLEVDGQTEDGAFHLPECRAVVSYYDPYRHKETSMHVVHEYVRASPLAVERYSWEWWQRNVRDWRYRIVRY